MGRGRRDPDRLQRGDALDFWQVEEIEPGRRILLKAEMKIPGEAYLQFETIAEAGGTTCLRSSALFRPRGLLGRLYWWALIPIHRFIFRGLNAAICERAARAAAVGRFRELADTVTDSPVPLEEPPPTQAPAL
jgi:hypothetical protein